MRGGGYIATLCLHDNNYTAGTLHPMPVFDTALVRNVARYCKGVYKRNNTFPGRRRAGNMAPLGSPYLVSDTLFRLCVSSPPRWDLAYLCRVLSIMASRAVGGVRLRDHRVPPRRPVPPPPTPATKASSFSLEHLSRIKRVTVPVRVGLPLNEASVLVCPGGALHLPP